MTRRLGGVILRIVTFLLPCGDGSLGFAPSSGLSILRPRFNRRGLFFGQPPDTAEAVNAPQGVPIREIGVRKVLSGLFLAAKKAIKNVHVLGQAVV